MNNEVIEPEPDHWHEFEPDECDPYTQRCTCGAIRSVLEVMNGEFA